MLHLHHLFSKSLYSRAFLLFYSIDTPATSKVQAAHHVSQRKRQGEESFSETLFARDDIAAAYSLQLWIRSTRGGLELKTVHDISTGATALNETEKVGKRAYARTRAGERRIHAILSAGHVHVVSLRAHGSRMCASSGATRHLFGNPIPLRLSPKDIAATHVLCSRRSGGVHGGLVRGNLSA